MSNCIKCGAELAPGAKFCVKCGNPVQDPAQQSTGATTAAQAAGASAPIFPADQSKYANANPLQGQAAQPQAAQAAQPQAAQPAQPQAAQPQATQPVQPQQAGQYQQAPQQAAPAQPNQTMQQAQAAFNNGMQQAQAGAKKLEAAAKDPKNKNTVIIIAVVAGVVVLAILAAIISAVAGGGYKKPIEKFEAGVQKQSVDKMMDAFPDGISYKDCSYLVGMFSDEDINDFDIKILDSEKLSSSDLADVNDYNMFTSYFDDDDEDSDFYATKAYKVTCKVTYYDGEKKASNKESETTDFIVGKVDGKWCIIDME